jgi:hypothetical protein
MSQAKPPKRSARRSSRQRVPRSPSLGAVVSFRQHAYSAKANQAAADAFGTFNFVLNQATNYTGFTDIWDVYRVDYLEFSFAPVYTANSFATFLTAIVPRIFTVIDLDDTATPTTINTLREYQSCQSHVYETFRIRFSPGVRTGIFDGTNVVAGGSVRSPWIDCAQLTIPHYGLKYGIEGNTVGGATTFQQWNVDLTVGLSFKYVR